MKQIVNKDFLASCLLGRKNDSHKGDYGHVCLVCGCDSMPGAAVLATGAALRSGCGLVTLHTSRFAAQIAAVSLPSAILSIDPKHCFSTLPSNPAKFNAFVVGPGLGRAEESEGALERLLVSLQKLHIPAVLDADALNIIASNPELFALIPEGSVLTPHDGELKRLVPDLDCSEKLSACQSLSDSTHSIVISKGYHTKIFVPGSADFYENTTGNPGMAKGGSGDVLSGLLGGLISRGYESKVAAMLGVWIHGYAGDCCKAEYGMESFDSLDLARFLHCGFNELYITLK